MEQESGFEQLFEEREWVRALAERLCADAATSEDLAQDTWLEALREGGKARGARGWLGGVLRNLVARRRTRDAARKDRERATARPEAVPGPDELLARAELQRRVLSAVANLPESYRSVVLLRHYEGLSAEDIARRSGESGSTARNRLARAHALLRERLDRDYGERSLWSTLLVPVSWGVSKEVVTGGMLVGAKLYVTAAAVALVGAVLWMQREETTAIAETLATVEVAAAPEVSARSDVLDVPRANEIRRELEPEAVAPRFDSVLVHGELRGVSGSLDSMSLTFTDSLGRGRRATLNGTAFAVPDLQPGEWRVTSGMRGYRTLDQRIELDGSQPKERRDFELEPLRSLRVRLVDVSSGELLKTSFSSRLLGCLSVIATRTRDAQVPRTLQRRLLGSDAAYYEANEGFGGSGQAMGNCSGVLTLTEATPLWLHVVLRDIVVATQAYDGGSDEVEFALDVQALQKLEGSLVVRCVDDLTGAPIVGARIEASFEDGGGGGMRSEAEGLVRLTGLPPGLNRVSAWVTQRPMTSVVARVEPGAEVELELRIPQAVRIVGQVVAAGVGRRATIEILPSTLGAASGAWLELGRSDSAADGRFEFPVMPAIRQRLVVSLEGFALAVRDVDATRGDVDLGEIALEAGTPVVLRSALGDARAREVLLLDAHGALLQKRNVSPAGPARWTLAPGTYGLRVFRDSEIVEERTLVVGTELLPVELGRQ